MSGNEASSSPEESKASEAKARREHRHRRYRRVAWGSGIGVLVLAALVAGLAWWLLNTFGGRDFLLARIKFFLPAGTEFTWESAEGPASGPMTLHGVRFVHRTCPDVDGKPVKYPTCKVPEVYTFTAGRVVLDPKVRAFWGRKLQLDGLVVEQATLDIPRSEKPFELPRWPGSLPKIEPPLPMRADGFRIDHLKVTRAGVPLVDIASATGGLNAEPGALHAQDVRVSSDRGDFRLHGDYAPADNYAMDVVASAYLPAPLGRTRPALGFAARGDLTRLEAAFSGRVPEPLQALLVLGGDAKRPTWTLTANTDGLDPGLMAGTAEPGTPMRINVQANGVGGEANVRGRFDQGEMHVVVQPSKLRIAEQTLDLHPVVVDIFGGRVTATGRGDFRGDRAGAVKFVVNARGLHWGDGAQRIGASSDFDFAGTTEHWTAAGRGVLVRGAEKANVTFDGVGSREGVDFKQLTAAMPQGRLDATGHVGWTPRVNWKAEGRLAGFDPGYFLPDWRGALNGRFNTHGEVRADGRTDIALDAQQLGGNLRGRAISGRATVAIRTPATARDVMDLSGDVDLSMGRSHLVAKGRIDQRYDVDATFSPLHLDDLLPSASGALTGHVTLKGPRNAPDIDADLVGEALAWGSYRAQHVSAKGRLPWQGGQGDITLGATGVNAGLALDRLEAHATGAMERLTLSAEGSGAIGRLALTGSTERAASGWRGTLASLDYAPPKGAEWRLTEAAQFAQKGNGFALSKSCFTSTAGGHLCADADWPGRGVHVDGQGLPLALVLPYLPEREDGRPWDVQGEFALNGEVTPSGGSWQGRAHLASTQGSLRVPVQRRQTPFTWAALVIDATFDANRIQAKASTTINGNNRVAAELGTGWDAGAPLSGAIDLDTRDLTLLELFSPDIVDPTGHLAGHILLGGSRANPTLGGDATLTDFRADLPALGLTITQGTLRMDALADGNARIRGSLRSGEGVLNVDGTLGWRGQNTPVELNVRGRNVLVSDTRALRAIADPDVVVRLSAGQPISVTGTVGLPSARIDLERLSRGTGHSSDVVVLDPVDPEEQPGAALDLDLRLALGDDVNVSGFGLKGTLGGSLRVRARPGREMLATGTLEVAGRYRAYGQNLEVTRGRLSWANEPVGNPLLDVRAERDLGDVTAGIAVTGRANRPEARVYTDPASSQQDALALLTTGRPLSGLDSDTARQVNAASAALSAGGSILASQLGARLGLDDAGVMQSRALGGSVLGIGKYLSPKLYVGYGISLLGTGQVLMLRYLWRKGFDVQIESSNVENRASVNWRKEK